MTVTHAHEALAEAFTYAIEELDALINRHFVAHRTLVVSNDEGAFWTAAIGDTVLYRSPDGAATLRFARTFAERTAGVVVEVETGYSVRVGALSERGVGSEGSDPGTPGVRQRGTAVPSSPRSESAPDNVVSLLGRVEA